MENKLRKTFYKSDLENGMVVETREGMKYFVLIILFGDRHKGINFVNTTNWTSDEFYDESLKISFKSHNGNFDIMKVFTPNNLKLDDNLLQEDNLTLIWDREYREKMTIYDIESELGYKIDLIDFKEQIEKEIKEMKNSPYVSDNEFNPTSHDGGWID